MLSHNQIKYINSLKIKKFRQHHKAFIIEGEKNINELIVSPLRTQKIFALPGWCEINGSLLEEREIEFQEITEDELKKVSDLVTPNQVLAIAEIPESNLPETQKLKWPILALDGIRDPGNLGTIIRTADWFGISEIICSSDCVDMYNPKVIQATMGSFSRINVHYTELHHFLEVLPAGIPVFGALLEGRDLTKQSFNNPGIILIGSESHGIRETLIPFINQPIHIPRFSHPGAKNQPESLNASIANGIICYEICKQLLKNNF